jgi:hypothetical protein
MIKTKVNMVMGLLVLPEGTWHRIIVAPAMHLQDKCTQEKRTRHYGMVRSKQ